MGEKDHSASPRQGSGLHAALIRKAVESDAFTRLLRPMGVPARITADDSKLLATACAACPDSPEELRDTGKCIEIGLTTASVPSSGMSCGIAVEGSRLRLHGPDFAGEADAEALSARSTVPPRLVGDPQAFAAELFDTLLLFLLARSGRTPIHAAGIVAGDTALALAGRTGSGKSTLAYAAAKRGLALLSDDTVFVQTEPRLRLWGLARPIHLFPEDAPDETHAIRLSNGKRKAVVPVEAGSKPLVADRALVVLLERGDRVAIEPVEPAEAVAALTILEPGFDLLPAESEAAARAISGRGGWRLTLGDDPGEAIDCLLERLR
jgi:hypothetical protein